MHTERTRALRGAKGVARLARPPLCVAQASVSAARVRISPQMRAQRRLKGFSCTDLYHLLVASETQLNFQAWRLCHPSATAWFCFERDKISSYLTRRSPVEDPHREPQLDKG
ncbi:hypothetical protein COCON_G00065770 [Conger conger]|uniref:Uncharacterized protein n=1 Tax=Conger conger TaxID=82655 RepID=A0A9Q1DSC2_CONCO|nr:hypothetical protein COCON_G00065770 [Conger conger]